MRNNFYEHLCEYIKKLDDIETEAMARGYKNEAAKYAELHKRAEALRQGIEDLMR